MVLKDSIPSRWVYPFMITIKTFIKRPNVIIENLNDITMHPEKYFISMDDKIELKKYSNSMDVDYLEGAITIEYNNRFIMGYDLWDLVDQLWNYFINLVEDVKHNDCGVFYFPDQPIKVELKSVSTDSLLFTIDEGRIATESLPKQEFINALLNGAENFFSKLSFYFGDHINAQHELDEIQRIKSYYK